MKNFWLTATMLMGLSSGALAATPWLLAVFLDNPQDGDSAEQYRDFSTLMGQAPVIMNAYTDFTQRPIWVAEQQRLLCIRIPANSRVDERDPND